MKKLFLLFTLSLIAFVGYADKAVYYPIYVANVEIYKNDVLTTDTTIVGNPELTVNMFQENCKISLVSTSFKDAVVRSIELRRQANLMMVSGILSCAASVTNSAAAIKNRNNITAAAYLANSFFYATRAYLDFDIMARLLYMTNDALVIPITSSVENTSNKILRGNIIVKPNEKIALANSQYVDEWRFSDNDNNIYCVRLFALGVREKGYISQEMRVAFVKPNKEEKKEHKKQYKRINLDTYETTWVENNNEELKYIKENYDWDKGYNQKPEPESYYNEETEY